MPPWPASPFVLRLLTALVTVALLMAAVPPATAVSAPQDWAIPNGWFFTQVGDGPRRGYSLTDDFGVRLWSEFQRMGGVNTLGYPVSRRFNCDGFVCQATQRVVLQWRPESNTVAFLNAFDLLSQAGKDDWLRVARQTPHAQAWNEEGMSWEQLIQQRLAVLEHYPDLGNAYYSVPGDPVELNGLPVSEVIRMGDALVLRAQRVVLQQWTADKPWARHGEVTVALGGDIMKEAGLLPRAALVPMVATTRDRGTLVASSPLPSMPAVRDDLEATKKLFAVYAFMNAGGYDDDNGRGYSAVRKSVREATAAAMDPDLAERVKAHYYKHADVLFSTFGNYAVTLSGSGPFNETDETPRSLQGTAPLLNEFYTKARVGALWEMHKSEYLAHLQEIMPQLMTPAQETFDYGIPSGAPPTVYVYVPNLLEAYGRASTSRADDKKFVLEGPAMNQISYVNTFRHEFAHSTVGPLVELNADLIHSKRSLFQQAPKDVTRYYRTWHSFVEECLVRAVTIRVAELTSPTPGAGEALLRSDIERGFFLVGPFVESLKQYETSGLTLREYAPRIFTSME